MIAIEARAGGQAKIPVHVFPMRMHEKGMKKLDQRAAGNSTLLGFWRNLKEGYDVFENNRRVPTVTVNKQGRYVFQ